MVSDYAPPQGEIPVLHEDSDLLVVDKPAGLLSVPGKGPELADCLLSRLTRAFPTVRLVHRLDRDTSGVMVFALTAAAQRHLGQQFETRKVKKTYLARVAGQLTPRSGQVDLPLTVDWPNRPRQMVCHATGKPAITDWKVVKATEAESRVRLFPLTGRSHQLRVHMLALGHPILGDTLYAPETASRYPRMMLHAEELRLNHPETGFGLKFRAKAPF
ncbi:RluA family pseudouridine synthase [Pseudoponticoccus marisrubri]|uniref:Pseudouridine synthase n=1 Tax=Pseudoponticoccus marisrubri TaxID=1685382 RepID=A0A0W7WQ55_9RHOB|nr:RluA family pseudouridine synthase [Pseudoponticoccus marisrubri]KUF12715.1 RNA pseudouridine synthase [Pseudoponticoccus marisrubri]